MKRLAAMQDWPLLIVRALTAVVAAFSTSAIGSTTKGSLPPSSSTAFLIWRARGAADRDAGALAAGQRDGRDPRVVDQRADRPRADQQGLEARPAGSPPR